MSCPICILNFNKSTQLEVVCHFVDCSYSACRSCVREYLVNTTHEPHCMNCKNKWDHEFTKNALTATYMKNDYKQHRATLLTDRMLSQRELYITRARQHKIVEEFSKETRVITEEIRRLRKELQEKVHQQHDLYRKRDRAINALTNPENPATTAAPAERKKFIMPCQQAGCKGMLSQGYKCELCDKRTCSACFEAITVDDHVCNPETVQTATMIRENSKPCPNCGTRISKIDGCSQMWCTECNTAFCWNTGRIETKQIHNPHYFEYLRRTGQQAGRAREVNRCNRFEFGSFIAILDNLTRSINIAVNMYSNFAKYEKDKTKLTEFIENSKFLQIMVNNDNKMKIYHKLSQSISHISYEVLPRTRDRVRAVTNGKDNYMINYMVGIINEDKLKASLINNDNDLVKQQSILDIYEAYAAGSTQMFQTICEKVTSYANNSVFTTLNTMRIAYDDRENTKRFEKSQNHELIITAIIGIYNDFCKDMETFMREHAKFTYYMNAQLCRNLLLHDSKRTLEMWLPDINSLKNVEFKNKKEIMAFIEKMETEMAALE